MLAQEDTRTLIDELLAEQQQLSAVERFSLRHQPENRHARQKFYQDLLPARSPGQGEQYAFQVDLDACSGCKACVTACHNRNGLEEGESWRQVGLLHSTAPGEPFLQTVTTACHHCVEPACLTGCPVLAYDKDPITGIVRHLDDRCMGCQYCVMKCPYEVPKYSQHQGIVRKCDMCASRLAVGEATACAQACPSRAIRITLVQVEKVVTEYRPAVGQPSRPSPGGPLGHTSSGTSSIRESGDFTVGAASNPFLPDSPDPQLTLPTTQFISGRRLPRDLIAADHQVLRLDNPHWPLVWMLVLVQAAAGTFLGCALLHTFSLTSLAWWEMLPGLILLSAGLSVSILHLGQPLRAWRAFLGWRTSWLSREIIAFNLAALFAALTVSGWSIPALVGLKSFLVCATAGVVILAVFASAMVYIDTGRPHWSPNQVVGNFFGTTLLLGASISTVLLGWSGASLEAGWLAISTTVLVRTALFMWRRSHLAGALRDPASPVHLNARVVRDLLPWTRTAQTRLFIVSTVLSGLGVLDLAHAVLIWAGLAAIATFASEIIARFVFFSAAGSKRMPGGIGP